MLPGKKIYLKMIDSEIFQPEILLIFISFSLVMAYYFGWERHVGPYWACFFAVFLPVMGFLVIFLSGNIKKRKSKPSKFKSLLGAISGSVGFLSLILLGLFSINKPSFFSENFIAFFPAIGLLLLGGYLRKRGRGISMNKFYINENNTNLSRHNELRFQGKADGFVSTLTYYSSLIICVLYFAGSEIGLLLFNAFPNSEVGRFVLKSVIFIDKNHYGANLNLGTTYNYTDDHEKAIDYFDRSIERSPKRSEPYYWRGDSKYFLNLYEEALIDLDIAIEKGYANKYSYCKRGNVNEKLKKTEEAI
jgi:tetratricopeptide (TPR) repeat protein